jgi:hypothetical protein
MINRFFYEIKKDITLKFDYKLGDILVGSNKHYYLITDYGYDDNQYWTESYANNSIDLNSGRNINIKKCNTLVTNRTIIKKVINAYIKAMENNNTDKYLLDNLIVINNIQKHLIFYKAKAWYINKK